MKANDGDATRGSLHEGTLTGKLQTSMSLHANRLRVFDLSTKSISSTRKSTSSMISTGPVKDVIINMIQNYETIS